MADLGRVFAVMGPPSPDGMRQFLRNAQRLVKETSQMAYDATHPSTFALFGMNDAQLKRHGLSPVQIQELRAVQRAAPPARTVEEVKAAAASLAAPEPEPPGGHPAPSVPRRSTRSEAGGE